MTIFDETAKEKYGPHVIEPSLGVDRTLLAVLSAAYTEDEVPNDKGKVEKAHSAQIQPKDRTSQSSHLPTAQKQA